jgi:hypothetical protein
MKKGKRILLLSLISLIAIGILLRLSQIRNVKEPIVIDNEVRGSETLNCEGTFEGVQTSIESFEIDREWYLIDDDNYNTLNIVLEDIQVSEDLINEVVFSYQIGEETGVLDYNEQEESWSKSLNIDGFEPSEYEVTLTGEISECDLLFSKNDNITVSYPVYVAWTMDWEGFDVDQKYLDSIRDISNDYRIPITHFFNPYIYLNLRDSRSEYLTNWVLSRQNAGDSIGLHLHMNNKMVEAAGVTPKTDISWGGWAKDGQDIPNTVYGYNDYTKIVKWAQLQFEKNSLPNPTMFRAGAWFIDEENLRVLEDLDFKLDSSGRTYKVYGDNKLEGPWDLESTTQPYKLNSSNQNIVNNPDMNLWEFPNNGADSWAYSSDQLIQNFKDNYNGGIANSRKVVTYLSHPHWFNVDEPKIINLLDYTQNFGIVNDRGPVVYTTLDKIEIN